MRGGGDCNKKSYWMVWEKWDDHAGLSMPILSASRILHGLERFTKLGLDPCTGGGLF